MGDTLLDLCAKCIGSHFVDLEQRLLRIFKHYVLPEGTVERILFHLPLNRLIVLEKESELSHLSQMFETFWSRICKQCSKRSCSFKRKLSVAQKAKPARNDSAKQILLNALFQEIMDLCLYDFVSKDDDLTCIHQAKRAKPSFLLQEAIEENKADIPSDTYLALLSKQVTNFNVYFRHIDMLMQMMTESDLFSKNLRKVTFKLRNPAKSCGRCSKWCTLLRMILKRDILSSIEICNHTNNCEAIQLLITCSDGYEGYSSIGCCSCSTDSTISFNDFTDGQNDIPKDHCDKVITDSCSVPNHHFTQMFLISVVSFEFNSISDTECSKELCHVLGSWYSLESLTLSFSKQLWLDRNKSEKYIVEENFTKGIWQLCKSGRSHLRCLVILNGIWVIGNLITIGSALNTSNVQHKSFTLEESVVHSSISSFTANSSCNGSIDSVAAEKLYFVNNDSVKVALSVFLTCFNPVHLTVSSSEASCSDLGPVLSHIVDLSKRSYFPGRLVSVTTEIESHINISNIREIFKDVASVKQVSFLIYHNYEETTIKEIANKFNLKNIAFLNTLKTSIDVSSIDDYVSEM